MRKWEQMDDACFLILEFRHAHAELTKTTTAAAKRTLNPTAARGGERQTLKAKDN